MFTLSQKKIVSLGEVSRDIGQILFASLLIEPIVLGHMQTSMILMGIVSTIIFFGTSVILSDINY